MKREYVSKKRPFFAGFLSLVPGLGQLYNEQKGKGFFLLFLFLASLFLLVSEGYPLFATSSGQFIFSPYGNSNFLQEHGAMSSHSLYTIDQRTFENYYPLFWFLLIFPLLVAYSVSDAMSSARRINQKILVQQPAMAAAPPSTPPVMETQPETQAEFTTFGTTAQATSPSEGFAEKENETSTSSSPPQEQNRKHSAKFLLGLILVVVSGMTIMGELHIDIFDWDHLWPLIPLFFGLRMLRDYHHEHDQGQFVLGMLFTTIGGIFFLENWTNVRPWGWVMNHWELTLLAAGLILIIQDIKEKRKREREKR